MRILISGGLGFIGSHLVEALKERGDYVVVVDDCSSNVLKPSDSPADNVLEQSAWSITPYKKGFDLVFHLAAPCGPMRLNEHGVEDIVIDTETILANAEVWGAKLVAFSTAEVIGLDSTYDQSLGDFRPDYFEEDADLCIETPYDIRSTYQVGKIAMECMLMASSYPDIQIVRPFSVVGPRQSPEGGFVLARFIEQAKKGEPLTVFYGGEQKRAFLSVHDVVDFCLLLRDKWPKEKGIWHLSNPDNTVTIGELASMVGLVSCTDGGVKFVGDPAKEVDCKGYRDVPCKLTTAQKAMDYGWQPKWDLPTILEEMLR